MRPSPEDARLEAGNRFDTLDPIKTPTTYLDATASAATEPKRS